MGQRQLPISGLLDVELPGVPMTAPAGGADDEAEAASGPKAQVRASSGKRSFIIQPCEQHQGLHVLAPALLLPLKKVEKPAQVTMAKAVCLLVLALFAGAQAADISNAGMPSDVHSEF